YCRARGRGGRGIRSARTDGLFPALLDVGADELLGILLEDLIDLVEDRLHVVAELLLAFLDLLASLRGRVLGLFAAPGGLSLSASVLRCHTVPPWSWASSLPSTVSSPASSQSTPRRGQRSPSRWPRTEIRQVGPGQCCYRSAGRGVGQPLPVSAATRSAAVRQRSISSPTCARVPRRGSRVGTRCSESWPGM